jgi:hypothetical protein
LGVNPDQKKKQYWPGEDLDDDKSNKENKPVKSSDKGNGKPKVCSYLLIYLFY